MKKLTATLVLLAMSATLVACGESSSSSYSSNYSKTTEGPKVENVTDISYKVGDYIGTYTGELIGNKANGTGKFTFNVDGESGYYQGEWVDGSLKGKASIYSETSDGKIYVYGTINCSDGANVSGKAGAIDLSGDMYYECSTSDYYAKYVGTADNGIIYGQGTKLYTRLSDGQYIVIEGEFSGEIFDEYVVGRAKYAEYNDSGKQIDCGYYEDGDYISNTEISMNNSLYDIAEYIADESGYGGLFDAIAPHIYDRDKY